MLPLKTLILRWRRLRLIVRKMGKEEEKRLYVITNLACSGLLFNVYIQHVRLQHIPCILSILFLITDMLTWVKWILKVFLVDNSNVKDHTSILITPANNLTQGSYNIPVTKFKAFSRPFQGLIIFFKAKQNWKNTRFITKCVSLRAYIYWMAHYVMQ